MIYYCIFFISCLLKFRYAIILTVILIQSSCQSDAEYKNIATSDAVSLDIDHRNSKLIESSDIEKLDIIIPETDEEFLLGDFVKIIFRDQKLFVKPHGRGKLFIFSSTGQRSAIIDHPGSGPGEYLHLTDFDVDTLKQQVIILDGGNRKVLYYSYDGDLISEKSLNMQAKLLKAHYVEDALSYIVDLRSVSLMPEQSTAYSINLFSPDWEFVRGYFEFSTPEMGMFGNPYMIFNSSREVTGYYKPFTDAIYHFEGHRMFQAYVLKFQSPVMSYEMFEADPTGNQNLNSSVYNIIYDENKELLYIEYIEQGQSYFLIYNKMEDSVRHFSFPEIRDNCSMKIFQNVLGLHNSRLVIQSDPSELPCIRKFFAPLLTDKQVQILDQIGEYDNNFLLLVQLK